jgi:hypothetical protein
MVSNVDYLLSLVGTRNDIIRDTWVLQGTMIASKMTRRYIKDNIFQVSCSEGKPLNGALIYCLTDYEVDNDIWPCIDWDQYEIEDIDTCFIGSFQGVQSPFFKLLLKKEDVDALANVPVNEDLDISGNDDGGVVIDDEQLGIMLTEVGVPFLRIDELEYTANAIKKYCLKPVFDTYFGFFPIIKEDVIGQMSGGTEFKKEFPPNAFAAVPYYVLGAGGGAEFRGAFSLYREQMMYGGAMMSGGGFGRGVSYRKPVPGFVGLQQGDANMNMRAAQQGYVNYFRREHVRTIKENGKRYCIGYSTVGGSVNVKWLCCSYDFDDIKFSIRTDFRNLGKAAILRNLGMLRSLVKSDVPGAIDFSLYNTRADAPESKVIEKWEKQASNLALSVMRGGLG